MSPRVKKAMEGEIDYAINRFIRGKPQEDSFYTRDGSPAYLIKRLKELGFEKDYKLRFDTNYNELTVKLRHKDHGIISITMFAHTAFVRGFSFYRSHIWEKNV